MNVLAVLLASSLASIPATIPDSVLFDDAPATLEQMWAIEGTWVVLDNMPILTLTAVKPGWMSFKIEKALVKFTESVKRFPAALRRTMDSCL